MSSSSNTDGNATQELDSEEMDPQVLPQLIGKKPIGKGRFGEVYKVDIKGAPNPYAVKVITKVVKGEEDRDAKEREMVFKNEYRSLGLMTKLSHQHVVPIIKTLCTNEPDTVYIQMQFCACNLRELINTKNSMFGRPDLSESKNNYPYTEPNDLEYFISLCWLREITLGLQYLHSKSIIHRDVKPENIVMGTLGDVGDTRWVLKLGDFGLAKLYQASRNNTNDVGTPKYMAPELAMARYTLKADLYSVGIVMPELFNYRSMNRCEEHNNERIVFIQRTAEELTETIASHRLDIDGLLTRIITMSTTMVNNLIVIDEYAANSDEFVNPKNLHLYNYAQTRINELVENL